MLQLVPFHRSARLPALEFPTAVHADEDRHATPLRNPPPCGGLAAARVVQVVPFHCSASVPASEPPTAVQAEGDVHATPARKAPAGLGAGWTRQLLPSHRSASALPGGPAGPRRASPRGGGRGPAPAPARARGGGGPRPADGVLSPGGGGGGGRPRGPFPPPRAPPPLA